MEVSIKRLYERFGFFNGVRVTSKQKLKFLLHLVAELEHEGIKTQLLKKKYRGKESFIAVIGDLDKADKVILTHYDTPLTTFGLSHHRSFNDKVQKRGNLIAFLLPMLFVLPLLVVMNLQLCIPAFADQQVNLLDLIVLFLELLLLMIVGKIAKIGGIPTFNTWNRNSSSVIAVLKSIENDYCKNKAFLLVDHGCQDHFGYFVAKDLLQDFPNKSVTLLDCVGSGQLSKKKSVDSVLNELFPGAEFIFGSEEKRQVEIEDENIIALAEAIK